ncbi:MAG: helix-hairpin-helix domain-containing protein [Cytophagaceae bacterium]|nr:helix-hairpin-helix domain-containing protein [Cytophagaceae bacterium]MDW8456322.1 helix-hairpin-helix domain-containing protein [Cytophagaceae bacterium]
MQNEEIIELFRLTASLMELHDENPFKIKAYTNAVYYLEKINDSLNTLSVNQLQQLEGIGKSFALKIEEIISTGSFKELNEYLSKTPAGVIAMLNIKGLGPKKIKTLWKEQGIKSPEELLIACETNRISGLKGFGEKTQENIKQQLYFLQSQQDKHLYASIENTALELLNTFIEAGISNIALTGQVKRKLEVIDYIQYVVGSSHPEQIFATLEKAYELKQNLSQSGPFVWRGLHTPTSAKVEVKIYPEKFFSGMVFIHSASQEHLSYQVNDKQTLLEYASSNSFASEEEVYDSLGFQYIPPEAREGITEIYRAKENKMRSLIELSDLKGILHNHTTYSDGKHTLEQMALYCKELGYQYLGITDHSQSASYAGGLQPYEIEQQHKEIELLNEKLAPFKIFKGIESDILTDGSLDYSPEVLASFDFIVASIHSSLKMDIHKATQRLIKAIENPYTTILGHASGRLLLKREGYPIDYKKVIDACVANKVIIEINANPRRLDMDWRWVRYAMDKDVYISINPDAHEMQGYHDMRYGVYVGRKALLTKEKTFNALPLQEVERWFKMKNKKN